MIDVHQVRATAEQQLYATVGGHAEDVRLEEIELSEDDHFWYVTWSYFDNRDSTPRPRHYKTVQLEAVTGDFRAVKIRESPRTVW